MENGIIKKDENFISLISNKGLDDVLKPLTREIHLFDTFIAGTAGIKDAELFSSLHEGDRLLLLREESKFDSNAISVLTQDRKKLGYIPERDNPIFARLMDAGKLLGAKISSITLKGSYTQVAIGIFLMDF